MSHRTQITLTDEQYARLLAESRRTGLGLADLMRRAVERVYGSTGPDDTLRALDQSFGSWGDRPVDGLSYVEDLRPGMARRLAEGKTLGEIARILKRYVAREVFKHVPRPT